MANPKIEFIVNDKDIYSAIAAHNKASGNLQTKAAQLAYSVAAHALEHGNPEPLSRLVSASPYGKRIERWALHHLPLIKNPRKVFNDTGHAFGMTTGHKPMAKDQAQAIVSEWQNPLKWKAPTVQETVTGDKAIDAAINQAKKMPEDNPVRIALYAVADMLRQGENPVVIIRELQSEIEHLKAQLAATAAQTKPATKTRVRAKAAA